MKNTLLLALCIAATPVFAQTYYGGGHTNSNSMYGGGQNAGGYGSDQSVSGYTRGNGTYVEPYHRTAPDSNPYNNYSTQGNVNPYTGQMGHKNPGY